MIIIIEKTEIVGGWADGVTHHIPLVNMDLFDLFNKEQLTMENVGLASLVIVTDVEASEFRAFKDIYRVYDTEAVYKMNKFDSMLNLFLSKWTAKRTSYDGEY